MTKRARETYTYPAGVLEPCWYGDRLEFPARVYGALRLVEMQRFDNQRVIAYSIVHAPTGKAVKTLFPKLREARYAAAIFEALMDWTGTDEAELVRRWNALPLKWHDWAIRTRGQP